MKAYVIECGNKSIIGFDDEYVCVDVKYEKSFLHSLSIRPISVQSTCALVFPTRAIADAVMSTVHIPNIKMNVTRVNMDMRTSSHIAIFKFSAEWLWKFMAQQ